MARDILGEYGPETYSPQVPRATRGGVMKARDVMNYATPVIPGWNPMQPNSPGLHGTNLGKAGSQGPNQAACTGDGAEGREGIHHHGGENLGKGTNRKG